MNYIQPNTKVSEISLMQSICESPTAIGTQIPDIASEDVP